MASLKTVDLDKPFYGNHKFHTKYKFRGDLLLDKISKGESIELNDNTFIVLDKDLSKEGITILCNREYDKLKYNKTAFYDVGGDSVTLSKFKKNKEFGSSAGRAGSKNTALQESSQCLINALSFNVLKREVSIEDIQNFNLQKAYEFVDLKSKFNDVVSFLHKDEIWLNSMILVSNLLFSKYGGVEYIHHRDSKFIKGLYNKYKIAKKKMGITINSDKWNASDIWLIDESNIFSFPNNLEELNLYLFELFEDNKLIGVSLKKTGNDIKIEIINGVDKKCSVVNYKGYNSTYKSNNVSIKYNNSSMTLRTFNYATNFAGEILGEHAAHGKIGIGVINTFLSDNGYKTLPSAQEIKNQSNDTPFQDKLFLLWCKYTDGENRKQFDEILQNKGKNYIVSKYLSLQFLSILESNKNKIEYVLSDIISYASSCTRYSSIFAKIS